MPVTTLPMSAGRGVRSLLSSVAKNTRERTLASVQAAAFRDSALVIAIRNPKVSRKLLEPGILLWRNGWPAMSGNLPIAHSDLEACYARPFHSTAHVDGQRFVP